MSAHTRGILTHAGAGTGLIVIMTLLIPGLLGWRRPQPVTKPVPLQEYQEAMERAHAQMTSTGLRSFYALRFTRVEVAPRGGETRTHGLSDFLESLIRQKTHLTFAGLQDDDRGQAKVVSPPFQATTQEGESPHRHVLWWSWDGQDWRIVRHRIEPVD